MKKHTGYYFERLYRVFFYALSIAIVLWDKAVPTLVVLLMLTWIAEGGFKEKLANVKYRFPFTSVFVAFYVLYLIGLVYSINLDYGLTDVLLKLPLILLPLIISSFPKSTFNNHTLYTIPVVFSFTTVAALILCYAHAFAGYYQSAYEPILYYASLSWFHHPSYLAMFGVFALSVVIQRLITNPEKRKTLFKIGMIGAGMILFVFIIMLSSRAGILAMMLLFIVTGVYILTEQRKTLLGILFLGLFIIGFYIAYLSFPIAFGRLSHTKDVLQAQTINQNTEDGTAQRILIWEAATDVIKDNLLLGVGTGDVKDELIKAYKIKGMATTASGNKNAHNQYIQTFAAIGLTGLIVLILSLLLPGLIAIKQHNLLYFLFLTNVGLNFLFESMLERQAGVIFFSLFNIVLFVLHQQTKPALRSLMQDENTGQN